MRQCAGLFLVLFIGFWTSTRAGETQRVYIDSVHTALLLEAQSAILDDQFDRADSIAKSLMTLNPTDPAGYVTLAASQLARMTDAEENQYGSDFTTLVDSIARLCTAELDSATAERAAWLYLFLGHSQAYRALYESKFGSGFRAVRLGLKTKESYEAGLRSDSTLYDLYFGLGSYHYWKSVKAGVFRWLGIFQNDIKRGIAELQLAADSSLLSRPVATASLAWVWFDREEFDSVLNTSQTLTDQYPHGKSFLWPIARAQFTTKNYDAAASTYRNIRSLLEANPGNHHNIVECDYYIAVCREKRERMAEAITVAGGYLSYEKYVTADIRQKQESKIAYLKRLAKESPASVSTGP